MTTADSRRAQIERYIALPWTWRAAAWDDEGEAYVVTIAELPDYFAAGATALEAWANARDALASLLDAYLAEGVAIPTPPVRASTVTSMRVATVPTAGEPGTVGERGGDRIAETALAYA